MRLTSCHPGIPLVRKRNGLSSFAGALRFHPCRAFVVHPAHGPAKEPDVSATQYRIAPYPANLIDQWTLRDGTRLTLRPVLPQDAPALGSLIAEIDPATRRRRFHGAVKAASASWLEHMACVDYRQHLALVVTCAAGDGERLVADARYVVDTSGGSAEFGLLVYDGWQRRGIGEHALRGLMAAGRRQGLRWLHGDVLDDNGPMLALSRRLQFSRGRGRPGEGCVSVEARLDAPQTAAPRSPPWWRRLAPQGAEAA